MQFSGSKPLGQIYEGQIDLYPDLLLSHEISPAAFTVRK